MADRSLDEFVDGDGEDQRDVPEADDSDDANAVDGEAAGRVPPSSAEQATATATWSPEAAACDDCGAAVRRRWHQDGALVCVDCREW